MAIRLFLICMSLFLLDTCLAQPFEAADYAEYQKRIVDKIATAYERQYVFPEKGKEVGKYLQTQFDLGKYNGLSGKDLAEKLTDDMRAITNDKHVRVNFLVKDENSKPTNSIVDFDKRFKNYGFETVKVLEGNIGYIDLRLFYPIANDTKSKEIVRQSMAALENTNAIVIDLRKCVGGSPEMISLIVSYFYPTNSKVHLNSFFYRPNNSTFESYTLESIDGRRMPDKKLYVLTGSKSFSAAEEFCYDLKQLKRATLVGAVTGGGAHTVEPRQIDENFEMFVPTGRAINPITKTNWEGVGVKPDVEVDEAIALQEAHAMALEELITNATTKEERQRYQSIMDAIRKQN